ncbi:esterase [Actinomycetota bacterium]|nr:esterase [Actinomycetota bacterium]
MPSLGYLAAKRIIGVMGLRWVYSLDESSIRTYLKEHANQQDQLPPEWFSRRYDITVRTALGSPIYVINPKPRSLGFSKRKANKKPPVVLFLHGGGFMFEAMFVHWMAVDKLIRKTGAEVWFCAYPLLPENTVYESSNVVCETYLQMLEVYGENRIFVLGDSAGAVLSLNLGHWLRKPEINLPQPNKIILVSPGQPLVKDKEQRAQMDAINDRDIMLNTGLLDVMEGLMPSRAGYDDFYEYPLDGDFFDFPPMVVFTGTDEVFYPLMDGFLLRVRGSGVPLAYYQGNGLCHCWPYVPAAPECRRGLNQLIGAVCY